MFLRISTLILSVLTYRRQRGTGVGVKPRANILNMIPTTDWSCFLLTPQKAMSRAPASPAMPPARIP